MTPSGAAPGHGAAVPRRRAWRAWHILVLAVLGLAAGLASRVVLREPLPLTGAPPDDGLHRVAGVVHVHTTLSDGGGTPEEVIAEAQAAGLGFVAITDHGGVDAKPLEGYHGGLLVMVGSELSTTAGHLLALGIADPTYRFSGDVRDGLDDVRELGGVAFATHPTSPREDFVWSGWDVPGPWGLELLNGDSQWREAGLGRLLRTVLLYPLNRPYALLGSLSAPTAALARWDALLAQRDVAGIGGADAHSRLPLSRRLSVRFPSYASLFRLMRNHVLLDAPLSGRASDDARRIVEALSRGRSYLAIDALAPAGGFYFRAERGAERWTMGDSVTFGPGLRLEAGGRLPEGARLRLLHGPHPVGEAVGSLDAEAAVEGVYRVEVWLPGWQMPWLISNPIYVFGPGALEARRARAALPSAELPAAKHTLESFAGASGFAPEFDPRSAMELVLPDPASGPAGGPAARIGFRLGVPDAQQPHTWCALVDRSPRDLSGAQGLVLWLKADAAYRMWVELRDANPASADEGTEWWFGSVRTSTEWRRVSVPFAALRSLNPASDGRLDLDAVRGVVFKLDRGSVKPGTSGTIWLAELGVY